ncbi:MAG TPA: RodZ domain-containing protein [Noviherbaspirillum sp.]|nr:RodZ domain-containing protein [Noviherbaspirillum sp.]
MSDPDINGQAVPAEQPNGSQALASPGARLAAYRNEKGWTVEQVASQLNLAPRQIVAIESDDYAALPGMPIVRGFIRAYAKLLKVDAAPLLATLDTEAAEANESIVPRKTLSTPFSEARLPSMTDRPGLSSKWIIGTLLVLLIGVAIWASRQDGGVTEMSESSSAPTQQGQVDMPAADKVERRVPDATSQEPAVAPGPVSGAKDNVGSGTSTALGAGVNTAPVTQSPQPMSAPAALPASNGAAPTGNNALHLAAREDSWVEIRRTGNSAVLVSRIVKAGESETVQVTEPVSLVIGNAAGVDASLRGVPLELKPGTKSNVARVNLK